MCSWRYDKHSTQLMPQTDYAPASMPHVGKWNPPREYTWGLVRGACYNELLTVKPQECSLLQPRYPDATAYVTHVCALGDADVTATA